RGEGVPAAEVWVQQGSLPAVLGRSDASGAFVLARCPLGPREVFARAPAHGTALVRIALDEDAPLRSLLLVLPAASKLTGRVPDAKGNAIAGAQVMAMPAGNSQQAELGTMAVADGEGRYQLDNVPLGQVRIMALAPGYRSADNQRLVSEPAVHDVTL